MSGLKEKIGELQSNYPRIRSYSSDIKDFDLVQKKLVLEVLSHGDSQVLELINANHEAFLALVETQGKTVGIKWDDLVIKFEWTF